MTRTDDYLAAVHRRLFLLDGKTRKAIIEELRGHIAEAARSSGQEEAAVLASLDSPAALSRAYGQIYPPSTMAVLLLGVGAILLAFASLPGLVGEAGATVGYVALVAYLLWGSITAGRRAGLQLAGYAFAFRLVGLGFLFMQADPGIELEWGSFVAFLAASALLLVVGYLPGEVRKRREGAERGPLL